MASGRSCSVRLRGWSARFEGVGREYRSGRIADHGAAHHRHVERLDQDRPAELARPGGGRIGIGGGEADAPVWLLAVVEWQVPGDAIGESRWSAEVDMALLGARVVALEEVGVAGQPNHRALHGAHVHFARLPAEDRCVEARRGFDLIGPKLAEVPGAW